MKHGLSLFSGPLGPVRVPHFRVVGPYDIITLLVLDASKTVWYFRPALAKQGKGGKIPDTMNGTLRSQERPDRALGALSFYKKLTF